MKTLIIWLRQDLRLADNAALLAALKAAEAVLPVYIHDADTAGDWADGGAARWWLHHALADLDASLRQKGSRLIIRSGDPARQLPLLLQQSGAAGVYWNRCYEPWRVSADGVMKAALQRAGYHVRSFNSSLLREPWELATQAGKSYRVYTPYARQCAQLAEADAMEEPERIAAPEQWPVGETLADLQLLPRRRWDAGLAGDWQVSRAAGMQRLEHFTAGHALQSYAGDRDIPGVDGTSKLSPYLHWGMIGPREVAQRLRCRMPDSGAAVFHRELIWREFAYHVLYHFPDTPEVALQPKFVDFPWREDAVALRSWQRGETGYPLVDAGMRQLWQTGWMHNRVRMVVASFLVKHLLLSWQTGARWFWDTLVDADLASNTMGWQWAGGCGADAAPYFRIFNPVTQSEKFDPCGDYIRRYVPELSRVPTAAIHQPWLLTPSQQIACDCRIGHDYPAPVVEHGLARQRALEALANHRNLPR